MPARPQNRNLTPRPANLGVTPLAPGEAAAEVRIRTAAAALRAFQRLTPAERGKIVADWHRTQ